MKNKDIHEAFGKIETTDETKEHIYWEIQRNAEDKKFLAKRSRHYSKARLDRLVPFAAVFVIALFGFSFYAVSSGLFGGEASPVPESTAGAAVPAPQAAEGAALPEAGLTEEKAKTAGDNALTTERASLPTPSAEIAKDLAQGAPITLTAYGAIDVGFTMFEITDIPGDPTSLWAELTRIGAVPQGITLENYSLARNRLILEFSGDLQTLMDKSATTSVLTAIAKSYRSLCPEAETLFLLSGGKNLLFQGEEVDATALMDEEVSVTDSKTLVYGGSFE